MRRGARWSLGVGGLIVAISVGAAVATGGGGEEARVETRASVADDDAPIVAEERVRVPEGFASPEHIAADPTRPGVWFFANGNSDTRLFFWDDAKGTLSGWKLGGVSEDGLLTIDQNAIALDSDGVVWVGINDRLFRFDPGAGALDRLVLPAPVKGDEIHAEGLPSVHAVSVIAAMPGGRVAVGMSDANQVLLVEPESLEVSTVDLPVSGEVRSLVSAGESLWAVVATREYATVLDGSNVAASDRLVRIDPAARTAEVLIEGGFLGRLTAGADEVLLGAMLETSKLGSVGADARAAAVLSEVPVGAADADYLLDAQVAVSGGVVALPTKHGVALASRHRLGDAVVDVALPQYECSDIAVPPGVNPAEVNPGQVCDRYPLDLGFDGQGNLWLLPAGPEGSILRIPAAHPVLGGGGGGARQGGAQRRQKPGLGPKHGLGLCGAHHDRALHPGGLVARYRAPELVGARLVDAHASGRGLAGLCRDDVTGRAVDDEVVRDVLRDQLDCDVLAGLHADLARREVERRRDDAYDAGVLGHGVGFGDLAAVHVPAAGVAHVHVPHALPAVSHGHGGVVVATAAGKGCGRDEQSRRNDEASASDGPH